MTRTYAYALGSILLGVLVTGCVKHPSALESYNLALEQKVLQQMLELRQMGEQEKFEEALTEDAVRDREKAEGKIRAYLALNCLCKHKAVLK